MNVTACVGLNINKKITMPPEKPLGLIHDVPDLKLETHPHGIKESIYEVAAEAAAAYMKDFFSNNNRVDIAAGYTVPPQEVDDARKKI